MAARTPERDTDKFRHKARSRSDRSRDIDSDQNALTDVNIENFFKNHYRANNNTRFGGVHSVDTVPYNNLEPFTLYVFNSAKEADPGEHWLSFTTTADTTIIKHFDSYGLDPLNNEQMKLDPYEQFNQINQTSPGDLQALGTAVCGEYVCVNAIFSDVINSSFQDHGFTWDDEMELDQEAKRGNDLHILSLYQEYNKKVSCLLNLI